MNLMLGDCLERMKEIPSGSVDMILADPPYGTTACKWDSIIPLDLMWAQLKRIIKQRNNILSNLNQLKRYNDVNLKKIKSSQRAFDVAITTLKLVKLSKKR